MLFFRNTVLTSVWLCLLIGSVICDIYQPFLSPDIYRQSNQGENEVARKFFLQKLINNRLDKQRTNDYSNNNDVEIVEIPNEPSPIPKVKTSKAHQQVWPGDKRKAAAKLLEQFMKMLRKDSTRNLEK